MSAFAYLRKWRAMVANTPTPNDPGLLALAAQADVHDAELEQYLTPRNWSFTPTMTSGTLGAGSLIGQVARIGDVVVLTVQWSVGAGGTTTGTVTIANLPTVSPGYGYFAAVAAVVFRSGLAFSTVPAYATSGDVTVNLAALPAYGAGAAGTLVTNDLVVMTATLPVKE